MTLDKERDALERTIADILAGGGYEARAEWGLGRGVVKCGVVGHEAWHFEVHVRTMGKGAFNVGIKRTLDDVNRFDGFPGNSKEGRPVRARSFSLVPGDAREENRLRRALRDEVGIWVRLREEREDTSSLDALAVRLQELIELEPGSAGEAIAALLTRNLDRCEMDVLRERIEEVLAEAPAP